MGTWGRRATRWLVIALVVIAGGWAAKAALEQRQAAAAPRTTAVERRAIVQSVVASGRVIAPQRVGIGSVVLGTVERVAVREGDVVKAGATLAVLKSDEQRAAVEQARSALAEAEARIRQLDTLATPVSEQSLAQARTSLAFAEQDYERTKKLYESGFYGRAKLDEVERNLQIARAARRSAEAQLDANRKGSELQLAVARRDQARAALEAARVRLANTLVVAPAEGVVLKRAVEPGDAVAAGRVLFEMSTGGESQILLLLDEKNLPLVRIGQPATILADAYPGQPFDAEVHFIAPGIDVNRGTVEVKLRAKTLPTFLRTDMTVSGELVVARRTEALVVPSAAIIDPRGREPAVLRMAPDGAGRPVRQPVKLGLVGAGETEIVEGVREGDLVVVPRPGGAAGEAVIPIAPR
jgi:HlyD family secretion protein